jgi:hypothetical protein
MPVNNFFSGSKRSKPLGSKSGLQGGWPITSQLQRHNRKILLAVWGPSNIHIFGPLTSTWPANDLKQTPTWSKLSPLGYRHSTPIYNRDTTRGATVGQTVKCQWSLREVWCVPSATVCRSENKVFSITVCHLFSETPLYMDSNLSGRSWRAKQHLVMDFVYRRGHAATSFHCHKPVCSECSVTTSTTGWTKGTKACSHNRCI